MKRNPARDGRRWARWHDEGMIFADIAKRAAVSPSEAYRTVKRYRLLREYLSAVGMAVEDPSEDPVEVHRAARLEMSFGSSCKPLKDLNCWDIHPCPRCLGWGEIDADGASRDEIESLVEAGLKAIARGDDLLVPCPECRGSRTAEIALGDSRTCYVCGVSGKDHLPEVRKVEETSEGETTVPAVPADGLLGGLG
jgi:hypothetical protein